MTSHELRHPLTSIKGQAQLMKRRERYSERAVDAIVEQTDRLGRLIDDLLLASLIEADRFDIRREPVDLVREVGQAVEQLQNAEHPIHIESPGKPFLILGDRQRLGQVFSNLISNAMKYSPDGCGITVRSPAGRQRCPRRCRRPGCRYLAGGHPQPLQALLPRRRSRPTGKRTRPRPLHHPPDRPRPRRADLRHITGRLRQHLHRQPAPLHQHPRARGEVTGNKGQEAGPPAVNSCPLFPTPLPSHRSQPRPPTCENSPSESRGIVVADLEA